MPATRLKIFISSVQKEFARQRADLKTFLLGDAFLSRFVAEVFLFEELPASDRRADEAYLTEVDRCDIYLGIFGNEYGYEDADGISPTEREYDRATVRHKTRLVYVWGTDDTARAAKMRKLIGKASSDLIRRRVESDNALTSEVYASIVDLLDRRGALQIPPFDTAVADGAEMSSIARERVKWFLDTAIRERGFAVAPNASTRSVLTHLNLIADGKPTNAAILLFGAKPQLFHRPAETKCTLVHGSTYERPFVSHHIYVGDLFEQANRAREFVLGNLKLRVGTRSDEITAAAKYELPPDAVAEAVINALVHRDYNSNASVEVRLFSDRLEVWNPGRLPGTLTVDSLREDHASVPNNPLIAEPMYLARYIEKAGTGTQTIIRLCQEFGLPEPEFEERAGSVVVTLWREWLTDELLGTLGLNERQTAAIVEMKKSGRVTNSEYQRITGATPKTAARDLDDLVTKGVLLRLGQKRGVYYVLAPRGIGQV